MKEYVDEVLKEIKTSQYFDEVSKKEKQILENSMQLSMCSQTSKLRLTWNSHLDVYEKLMDKHTRAQHKGIRIATFIDKDNLDTVMGLLNIGVKIRHVKNLPPNDFVVSDKQVLAFDKQHGELLSSNDSYDIDNFTSIFEDLWKKGVDAQDRIRDIE